MNRRDFIGRSASLAIAWGIPYQAWTRPLSPPPLTASIKLSCNAYSFNGLFRAGQMNAEDMIDFCGTLPLAAIDLTGYYLGTYPAPPSPKRLFALKKRAFRHGLDISGTGVRNDFCTPDSDRREAALAHVREWVQVAAQLDAPVLRVFTGRPPADAPSREDLLQQVADCLLYCADYGGEHGVMIVLQNHNELLYTAEDTLDMLERADHPWLGLCLDIGSLRQSDPYTEIERLAPYAVTWQVKEQVYRQGTPEDLDLARLARIMHKSGYRGYAPLEILNSDDPKADLATFTRAFQQALDPN